MDRKEEIEKLLAQNRLNEAVAICEVICDELRIDAEACFACGLVYGRLKRYQDAEKCYEKVVRLFPDMGSAHFNRGIAFHSMRDYENAVRSYEKTLEIRPEYGLVYVEMGGALYALGRHELALDSYKQAIALNAEDASVYFKLGLVYSGLRQHKEAENSFRKAIALRADYIDPYVRLGVILQHNGRHKDAQALYEECLNINPDCSEVHNNLGLVYKDMGCFREAFQCFKRAVGSRHDYADAYSNLGNTLQLLGRQQEAISALRTAVRLKPDSGVFEYNLGVQLEKTGDLAAARVSYSQVLNLVPEDVRGLASLARVCTCQLDFDEAIKFYKKAIEVDSQFVDGYVALGKIYTDLGIQGEACRYFRAAIALQPDNPTAKYFISSINPGREPSNSQLKYIEDLFDQYADTFEDELVNVLNYQTPQVLYEVVSAILDDGVGELDILDLGCGTGLCGELFRDCAGELIGIDLSSRIIEKAREKNVYDGLFVQDLKTALEREEQSQDIILAADVFVYSGALEHIFCSVVTVLRKGGLFAFSVEHQDEDGYRLHLSGRYSHSLNYISACAEKAGMVLQSHKLCHIRQELGRPVDGDILVYKSV